MGSHGLIKLLHNKRTEWKGSLQNGKYLCQLRIIQKIKAKLSAIPKCKHQKYQIIQSINGPMNSRHLSEEEMHMANKCLTFSPVLAFKEILIKTSLRVHFIPFRTPIIKRRTRKRQQMQIKKWERGILHTVAGNAN